MSQEVVSNTADAADAADAADSAQAANAADAADSAQTMRPMQKMEWMGSGTEKIPKWSIFHFCDIQIESTYQRFPLIQMLGRKNDRKYKV